MAYGQPYQHTARRPHGFAEQYDQQDRLVQGDTVQCIHCQGHRFVSEWRANGSPFCMKCMGPICGDTPDCANRCVHWAKELEQIERKAAEQARSAGT